MASLAQRKWGGFVETASGKISCKGEAESRIFASGQQLFQLLLGKPEKLEMTVTRASEKVLRALFA